MEDYTGKSIEELNKLLEEKIEENRDLEDMKDDPEEQKNLINNKDYQDIRNKLEDELSNEVMKSIDASMNDRLAQNGDMSQDPTFGFEGWQRPWPHPPKTKPAIYEKK